MSIPTSEFDSIINHYFEPYKTISRDTHILAIQACINDEDFVRFKIKDNKLYQANNHHAGGRLNSFKYMMLKSLEKYNIRECDFVIYTNDGIRPKDLRKVSNKNGNPLPIIVTTSVYYPYNFLLCPDFTFSFSSDYNIKNNEEICKRVVEIQENVNFSNKINKMVWRGSGNTYYRHSYLKNDNKYDIQHTENIQSNNEGTAFTKPNAMTREEKADYKYHLYLNGHEGIANNGAYSSSFKWAIMCKSLVFYSAPDMFREFWNHPSIFKEGQHYVYTKTPEELDSKYKYYMEHPEEAEKIANQSFEFFKKYLMNYDNLTYYMQQLLNTYSSRMDFAVVVDNSDRLIDTYDPAWYCFKE